MPTILPYREACGENFSRIVFEHTL